MTSVKQWRRFLALILSAAMTLALTACGGSTGTSSGTGSTGTDTSTDTSTADSGTTIDYPTSAITMIVNYSAGGGTDLAARAIADAAAGILGGTITPSNITGGSGTVGVTELANSKNDGYTIGVATLSPLALVPWQLDVTYTPDDFEYICAFSQYGYGIVVAADSPYQTLDDLLDDARAKTVKFGATGYPQPFTMEDLGAATGASFEYVNYASTTDLITDVLGGFVPFAMCDMASFASYVKSGDMRLLASATDKRWDVAPDVPTLEEMGYEGVVCNSYMGMCVPAGTPDEIVQLLRDAFAQASEDEDYKQILLNCNLTWAYMDGDEYEALVREMYAEFGERLSAE
jgi:tripartite-type tricarboxylate transporter receptor subunit TctC